ncbi:molybdopterin biosynthesis protein [Mailhella sp.]|uniref:molybdopterin biosynthesis protein n=1 Tax=Mailhella sp. TaxID=1981029 RepID=UPI0040635361
MARNTYLTMKTPTEARELWFSQVAAADLGEEQIPLQDALHRVLSRPVEALRSSPAFHGAAMDGVAVKAEATFTASPRRPLRLEVGRDAFWINTGHPLPAGTNAVIKVEELNTDADGRFVGIEKAAFPWQHVRKLGEDMVATEIILAPGIVIGAYELGALAAAGVLRPTVFRRPKVAVIPSGSEIVSLGEAKEEDLRAGRVLPEFNSLVFSALIREAGGEVDTQPIVPDDPDAIRAAILAAAEDGADLIMMNAGSSAGSHDYTAEVIRSLGELFVHGIAVMPGKPTALGLITAGGRRVPVIGTPGYPVSAIVAVEEFVLPLLALWQSRSLPRKDVMDVVPCNALPSRPGMEERIRVRLGMVGDTCYAVSLPRGAGTVTSLSRADAVIRVPRDSEGLDAGQPVQAELIRTREQIEGALLIIGSHDSTLDIIDSMLRRKHPRFRLTSAHVGSLGGLLALNRGQCHLAGSHLLDEGTGEYNRQAMRDHLKGTPSLLVHLADREQGFIVLPGNPKGITSFEKLLCDDVSFINRQRGSGTRVLLDWELKKRGISPAKIHGYRDEEYTHMNVAAAVLSGRADCALGVRSAAVALGLDFVPVGVEQYDLVISRTYAEDERMLALLDVIRSTEFRDTVTAMGGYDASRSGTLLWEYDGE